MTTLDMTLDLGGASITLFSLLQVRSLMKRKIVGAVDTISNKNYFLKSIAKEVDQSY